MKKKSGEERVKTYFMANPTPVFVGQVAQAVGLTPGYCAIVIGRLVASGELQTQRVGVNGRFWLYAPAIQTKVATKC